MRRVALATEAEQDLDAIGKYIRRDSPGAALRVIDRIEETIKNLALMPTARAGRIARTYEKPVHGLPYIIAFELPDKATLRVLRIIHTSRDWSAAGWPEA